MTGRVILPLPKPKSFSLFLTPFFPHTPHLQIHLQILLALCSKYDQNSVTSHHLFFSLGLGDCHHSPGHYGSFPIPNRHHVCFSTIPPPATGNPSHLVKVILLKYNHFLVHHSAIKAQDYKVLLALILCLWYNLLVTEVQAYWPCAVHSSSFDAGLFFFASNIHQLLLFTFWNCFTCWEHLTNNINTFRMEPCIFSQHLFISF